MRNPLIASLIGHAVILALLALGLPWTTRDPTAGPLSTVEIMAIGDLPQIARPEATPQLSEEPGAATEDGPEESIGESDAAPETESEDLAALSPPDDKPAETQAPPPKDPQAGPPAGSEAPAQPAEPVAPPPPPSPEPEPGPAAETSAEPEPAPVPGAEPVEAPEPQSEAEPPPQPPEPEPDPPVAAGPADTPPPLIDFAPRPPDPATKPDPEPKPKSNDFAAVLKNLEELDVPERTPEPRPEAGSSGLGTPPPGDNQGAARGLPDVTASRTVGSDPVTGAEIDNLRRQIERCWNIPAGLRDADDLIVRVRVIMNRNGTPAQVTLVDAQRLARDGTWRAAAESARRAVLNPRCHPFKLPPEKFDDWKTLVLTFNPKELVN